MLEITLGRLRRRWPDAVISVLNEDAARLGALFPDVYPLSNEGRRLFHEAGQGALPFVGASPLRERRLRAWLPWATAGAIAGVKRLKREAAPVEEMGAYVAAVRTADLVVASGGGYLTDSFPWIVRGVYQTFGLARRLGKPTALLGQGVGPLRDPEVTSWVREIVTQADFISLREGLSGPSLLSELGVSGNKVVVTGDDAIEAAFAARPAALGDSIGVGMRMAQYSPITAAAVAAVRQALTRAAQDHQCPLIPLPVSFHGDEDCRVIRDLVADVDPETDGGIRFNTTRALSENVGRCRVVVTGTYHSAVFALAQGIPAIALVSSPYYVGKLRGLADQFGAACPVVSLEGPDLAQRLRAEIEGIWDKAPMYRGQLLESASEQIQRSLRAYDRLFALVGR